MAIRTVAVNLTSSGGVVAAGECWIEGFYVNSTTNGTIKFYNNPSAASDINPVLTGTITPAIGFHSLVGMHATAGCYALINSGLLNVTVFKREAD